MELLLSSPVRYVKGVGVRKAEVLAQAGIQSVEDLLRWRPLRYEDRTNFKHIRDLRSDEEAVVRGTVLAAGSGTTRRKRLRIFEASIGDDSGRLAIKFFNQGYLESVLTRGREVVLYGMVRNDEYSRGLSMVNPEFEVLSADSDSGVHTGRIVPIYRRISEIAGRAMRRMVHAALEDLTEEEGAEILPDELLQRHGWPRRLESYRRLHFPECPSDMDREGFLQRLANQRDPIQQRFICEEFYLFQFGLQLIRQERATARKSRSIQVDDRVRATVKSILPFRPTSAQKRVLKEIVDDLRSQRVMSRLLQGDVGSGKTIVALQAIAVVAANGWQAALMVPTELLAEQHARTARDLFEGTGLASVLLTGSVKGKARREVLRAIAAGEADLVVGTHALIQSKVEFSKLGLVVVDEQHRFGVMQRMDLMGKGERPDVLVMTATPIPRSLALTVYGDLDLSVIDELPPGRKPVRTLVKHDNKRGEVYDALRRQLDAGRQVYIVYPLVEQSEKSDLRAAVEMSERLAAEVFPQYEVGLLHGRMKSDEKQALMQRFVGGEVQILVSTTVIEVGIDVANATIMVIENAERFGLSQLHQLRGRIGRGDHDSYCILIVSGGTQDSFRRLETIRASHDGFVIAEKDLEIRGPGEFVGTKQSGVPEFRFGNIVRDRKWLELARQEAETALRRYAAQREAEPVLHELRQLWKERHGLSQIG